MHKQIFLFCFSLSLVSAALGQTKSAVPAPMPVSQILYHHWPQQFMQWVGTEVPYSMIELYVDRTAGPEPLYEVVLTQRNPWKRIHYSNQQALVDSGKKNGWEAYLVKLQFDVPASAGPGAKYLLRFSDQNGTPVLWQFVQGSDVTDQGAGLSPAGLQPPVLSYREQSAVAGEGTALKVGKAVSVAEVWKEIAVPPYFNPYRGALTENFDIATFVGPAKWTVEQAPASLAVGSGWKLKSADSEVTLSVAALKGNSATFVQTNSAQRTKTTFEATLDNGTWFTRRVHFEPLPASSAKGMTVSFTPDGQRAKFEVSSGKTRIASGFVSSDFGQAQPVWQFKDPDWLKSKSAQAQAQGVGNHSAGGR